MRDRQLPCFTTLTGCVYVLRDFCAGVGFVVLIWFLANFRSVNVELMAPWITIELLFGIFCLKVGVFKRRFDAEKGNRNAQGARNHLLENDSGT